MQITVTANTLDAGFPASASEAPDEDALYRWARERSDVIEEAGDGDYVLDMGNWGTPYHVDDVQQRVQGDRGTKQWAAVPGAYEESITEATYRNDRIPGLTEEGEHRLFTEYWEGEVHHAVSDWMDDILYGNSERYDNDAGRPERARPVLPVSVPGAGRDMVAMNGALVDETAPEGWTTVLGEALTDSNLERGQRNLDALEEHGYSALITTAAGDTSYPETGKLLTRHSDLWTDLDSGDTARHNLDDGPAVIAAPSLAAGRYLSISALGGGEVQIEVDQFPDIGYTASSTESLGYGQDSFNQGGDPRHTAPIDSIEEVEGAPDIVYITDMHGYYDSTDNHRGGMKPALLAVNEFLDEPVVEERGGDLYPGTGLLNGEQFLVFGGDATDRGPQNDRVIDTVHRFLNEVEEHTTYLLGNHDVFLTMPQTRLPIFGNPRKNDPRIEDIPEHLDDVPEDPDYYWANVDDRRRGEFLSHMARGNIQGAFVGYDDIRFQHSSGQLPENYTVPSLNQMVQMDIGQPLQDAFGTSDWPDSQHQVYADTSDIVGDEGFVWARHYNTSTSGDSVRKVVGHDKVNTLPRHVDNEEDGIWRPARLGDRLYANTIRPHTDQEGGEAVAVQRPDGDISVMQRDRSGRAEMIPAAELPAAGTML